MSKTLKEKETLKELIKKVEKSNATSWNSVPDSVPAQIRNQINVLVKIPHHISQQGLGAVIAFLKEQIA